MANPVSADDHHSMTPSPAHTARHHPAGSPGSAAAARPPQDVFVPSAEAVARRAHLLFENHGEANGRDMQDWLQAEAELTAEWQCIGK